MYSWVGVSTLIPCYLFCPFYTLKSKLDFQRSRPRPFSLWSMILWHSTLIQTKWNAVVVFVASASLGICSLPLTFVWAKSHSDANQLIDQYWLLCCIYCKVSLTIYNVGLLRLLISADLSSKVLPRHRNEQRGFVWWTLGVLAHCGDYMSCVCPGGCRGTGEAVLTCLLWVDHLLEGPALQWSLKMTYSNCHPWPNGWYLKASES